MVYPGSVEARVNLNPGDVTCSGVTAHDTSCTVSIASEGVYAITLTLTNDVGSTQPIVDTLDRNLMSVCMCVNCALVNVMDFTCVWC